MQSARIHTNTTVLLSKKQDSQSKSKVNMGANLLVLFLTCATATITPNIEKQRWLIFFRREPLHPTSPGKRSGEFVQSKHPLIQGHAMLRKFKVLMREKNRTALNSVILIKQNCVDYTTDELVLL